MSADLHYFSGDSAFSLSRLDANTRHIAELERQYVQLPGGNDNMPFHCREGLAFFTPSGAPKLPEGVEELGPIPAEESLWAPGLVDRIAYSELYDAPRLEEGCIYLPLAGERAQGEGKPALPMPGAIRGAAYVDLLRRPRLSGGVLQLPLANTGTTAADFATGGVFGVSPSIGKVWEVRDGVIMVPMATSATYAEGEDGPVMVGEPVPGVLSAVEVVQGEAPVLQGGSLLLNLAEQDSAAGVDPRAGLLAGVEFDPTVATPCIRAGVLHLPGAATELCDTATAQVGLIRDIEATGSEWGIDKGSIKVPLAQHFPAGEVQSVPGVLTGVEWTEEPGITEPYIWQGVLHIPYIEGGSSSISEVCVEDTTARAGWVKASVLRLSLADSDSSTGSPQTGLIAGVTPISGGTPRIERGVLMLPQYSFNEEQFDVQADGRVSLLHTPLEGLYDAANNKRLTWAELQEGSNVRLSYSSSTTLGVSVKMFGNFLSIYVDRP